MRRFIPLFVILTVAFSSAAGAVDTVVPEKKEKVAQYVQPAAFDMASLLVPPPAADSATTKAELAMLHRIQEASSPERIQIAIEDYTETAFAVVRDNLGPGFAADKLPIAAAFFERVLNDEGLVVDPVKDVWARTRPLFVDTTLTTCKPQKKSASYPSGHATVGYLTAIVLSDMIPEKREVLFASAARFAESRLVCAVHYPSDLDASRTVAAVMVDEMRRNAKYKKDFAAAKSEVRHALRLD